MLFQQQLLIGRIAAEDDGLLQQFRELLGAFGIAFNQFDVVAFFQLTSQPGADVATTHQHDAAVGVFQPLQLGHHGADVAGRRDEKDLIIGLDDGGALRPNRLALPENGGYSGLDVGHVFLEGRQRVADQRAAIVGLDGDQADATTGKIDDLQGARVFNQAPNVVGHQLFR